MKDSNDVIKEFNEIVNMTASDLEKWLKSGDSRSAGWPKDESGDGESVGHDSGRKIVEILKANPEKKEDKYTEEQVEHMRKVVAYCKRHLAQEEKANKNKSTEEVKKTKSYASLKNWGHDFLKKEGREDAGDEEEEEKEAGGEEEQEEEEEVSEEDEEEDQTAGDKRKKAANDQSGANKKRETAKGKAANGNAKNGNKKKEDDEKEDDKEEEKEEDEDDEEGGEEESSGGKKPKKGPKPGETVSWNWGSGNPEGKVLDVKADEATITTKRGNKVSRKGDEEDPAVVLDTGKSKAIKSNHELNG